MIDLSLLRNNPEEVKANLSLRGFDLDISLWETLEKNRKAFQVEMENFQAEQNKIVKEIGLAQKNNESIDDVYLIISFWSAPFVLRLSIISVIC